MPLFQKTVLKKHLQELNTTSIDAAYERFVGYFQNATIQQNIRNAKEEQFQEGFLRELFGTVLNYTLNPQPDFNLTTELKNTTNSKKADGAILVDNKAVAVIELKGTETTDLNKIEVQAFGYKNNQAECNYVITSNFEKLRFYIDNTIDYEEFNLFTLTRDQFNLLYLCLAYENIKDNVPKRLKTESVSQEDQVTKKLYKDYSEFKRALYNNLVEFNPQYDKLLLFKKSQKLLDRFLFIFFAEDTNLLPSNLIFRINAEWKNLQAMRIPVSLYERYIIYFNDLNTGAKVTLPAFGKKTGDAITAEFEIFAYNGGLFQPDEVLDTVKIDDTILHTYSEKLSHYDFDSDIDVNILGHIFENSLNEIDEIKSEIEGTSIEKTKTKRKKDGVFYTPKYITKYIVDNTVGKLCVEKKAELKLNDEDYISDKKLQNKTKKGLLDKLSDYRAWLLQLTICDPACGSGAFLNQALDFLIAEHRYVDELQAKLMGDALILSDIETSILENNIYGVDLNDESVEIAKLSLWLRTAQKGRKLNSLNKNIKCGNSLIDDPAVAGEKAFLWEKEFPEVFASGGFDVVIGNPPYVRHESIKEYKPAFQKKFESFLGTADLYVYFIDLGIRLLNAEGKLGFINPNKFIRAAYGDNLKKILSRYQIEQLIDFGELNVFQDAVTSPLILIVTKASAKHFTKYVQVITLVNLDLSNKIQTDFIEIDPDSFQGLEWNLVSKNELSIINKVSESGISIAKHAELDIKRGLLTGLNEAFIIDDDYKTSLLKEHPKSGELIKKFIDGDDVRKYEIRNKAKYLICIPSGYTNSLGTFDSEENAWLWMNENYTGIMTHLENYKEKAKKRTDKGNYWWELRACDYYGLIEKPKIIYPEIAMSSRFALDLNGTYINKTIFLINSGSYSLLGLLNSKLIWYYLLNICASLGNPRNGGRLNMQRIYLETIGLPKTFILGDSEISSKTYILNDLYLKINGLNSKFQNFLLSQTKLETVTKKIKIWHDLSFPDFIKELNKAIKTSKGTPLTKKEEFEWMELFEENKKKALELKAEIDKTDKEIDAMVYELYGLTEEEIGIVENS